MLTLKKSVLLAVLFQVSCLDAMNLGHIIECHVYDENGNYTDIVKNSETGVISAVNMHNRKTIFPEEITEESIQRVILDTWYNGKLLAETETLKYMRHPGFNLVIGVAKDLSNNIVTAYPVLQYIPLSLMKGVDNNSPIYIATVHDKKNKTSKIIESKAGDIRKMRLTGLVVATRRITDTRGVVVVDVSSNFTNEIFSGIENKRGSILVEANYEIIEK